MVATDPNLVIKISGNSKQFEKELKSLEKKVKASNKRLTKSEIQHQNQSFNRIKESEKNRIASFNRIKKAALALSVVTLGISVLALRAFSNYETALVAVVRTTGLAGKELNKFEKDIKNLSRALKTPEEELLKIAEVAGQLGVKGAENITKFTAAMAKFNVASATLKGEAAASAFARIIQLTGGDISKVENYGSAVAHLADNFNATEAQIAETAKEIAKTNAIFALSTENTIAIATGFASVGVQADVASTTIGMFAKKIDEALTNGGSALNTLSVITGMTASEIEKNLIDAPEKVFVAFTKGLGEVGRDAGKVLTDLGLNNIRTSKSFLSAAKNIGIFESALLESNEASEKNIKLQQETELVLKTVSKGWDGLKDSASDALRAIGEVFAPAALKVMNGLEFAIRRILFLMKDVNEEALDADTIAKNKKGFEAFEKRLRGEDPDASTDTPVDSNEKLKADTEIKNEIVKEGIEKEAEIVAEGNVIKDEVSEERRTDLDDLLKGLKEEKLEADEEAFDKELKTLDKRLKRLNKTKEFFVHQEIIRDLELLKTKTENAKKLAEIDKQILKAKEGFNKKLIEEEITALKTLFDEKTAIGKAAIIADKAFKISNIIMNTSQGISRAFAEHVFPKSAIIAGVIATKGAAEIATVSGISAQDGGIVPGGFGGGDRIPALLEPGEIIVPQKFNPLSPNFEEGGASGGGQEVNVTIGLEEDASRVLTVKQREDSRLGLQE